MPRQCQGSTGYCWCVDILTGIETPGSRVPPGNGRKLKCPLLAPNLDASESQQEVESNQERPSIPSQPEGGTGDPPQIPLPDGAPIASLPAPQLTPGKGILTGVGKGPPKLNQSFKGGLKWNGLKGIVNWFLVDQYPVFSSMGSWARATWANASNQGSCWCWRMDDVRRQLSTNASKIFGPSLLEKRRSKSHPFVRCCWLYCWCPNDGKQTPVFWVHDVHYNLVCKIGIHPESRQIRRKLHWRWR